MADVPKGKAGLIKSIATLNVPELYNKWKKKKVRNTIKTFLAGTGLEGAANEVHDQFKTGNMNISRILGKAASNIAKRAGQVYSGAKKFGKGVIKEANLNEGGMAYARKKNMGLKMNSGGSVKSKKSKKKVRGTGAAKRGTKFKGTF